MKRSIGWFKKQRLKLRVNLPVDPRLISSLSVLSSLLVFWDPLAAVSITLALDLLDGAVARARGMSSREGGLFDYSCDRYSEFIFASYYMTAAPIVLLLPGVNTALTYKVAKGRLYILPLRSLLLFALIFNALNTVMP